MGSDWLIIQLNDSAEIPGYREIERAIKNVFGDSADYFIPIHYEAMGSYISSSVLVEGYAFVRDSSSVRASIVNISEHKIFTGLLHKGGKYQTISSRVVAGMKKKLKNSLKRKFAVSDKVIILDGVFKNLVGEVVGVEDDAKKVFVKITRISREMIVPIPSTLLEYYHSERNTNEDQSCS